MLCFVNSSPVINTSWTDSSVFITAARTMLEGRIIYRDIFDHKGFYIYAINFLGALMSNKSLTGLWLVELLFMLSNAFIIMKIYKVCCPDENAQCVKYSLLLIILAILWPPVFEGGNLSEEYTLTFQFLSIYLAVKYINSDYVKHSPVIMLVHGINAGIVLNMRPNHVFMWAGLGIVILLRLITKREYLNILHNFIAGIAGVAVGCLPVVIYALVNNSLRETVFCTFIFNFMYLDANNTSLLYKIFRTVLNHREIFILSALFISCMIIMIYKSKYKLYFFAMALFSVISIALSGRRYGHYYMYIIPVLVIPSAVLIKNFADKTKLAAILKFIAVIMILIMLYKQVKNCFNFNRENINLDVNFSGKRVLVTGNHARYYILSGVCPNEKYFYVPDINYNIFNEAVDAQVASIMSAVNDVIIYTPDADKIYNNKLINETLETKYNMKLIHNGAKIYIKKGIEKN